MWFVYVVKCSDNTLYTGISTNVEKRIHAHNTSKCGAKYTKSRRPVKLMYVEEYFTRSDASKREYSIKQLSRIEKYKLIKCYGK